MIQKIQYPNGGDAVIRRFKDQIMGDLVFIRLLDVHGDGVEIEFTQYEFNRFLNVAVEVRK
jgi:hypothetical protein